MLLISICTILMLIGFLAASNRQYVIQLDNGEMRRRLQKTNAIFLAGVLIVVSTLRYGFVDTYAYKIMYTTARNNWNYIFTGADWGIETGWLFLNYILNYVSKSPKLILFLSALVINLAYVKSVQRYSEDACLSFFLYFCLIYLDTNNGLRQMVAAAIVMLALPLLERKKYLPFAFWILVAYQMHNSAIVWFVIALAVVGEPFNIRTKAALGIGILFLFTPGTVTGLIDTALEDSQYNYYLDMRGGMRFARALVTGIVPGIFSYLFYRKRKKLGTLVSQDALIFNLTIINTIFVLMGTYMQYWNRFSFYTFFAMVSIMPRAVREVVGDDTYHRIVRPVMLLLYFAYFCYNIFANSGLPGASSNSLQQFYIEWWC